MLCQFFSAAAQLGLSVANSHAVALVLSALARYGECGIRRLRDAIDVFADLMELHDIPKHTRSDNGPERVAKNLRRWLARVGKKTVYITPGSPCESGYRESFNGKLRDEPLNGELFYTLREMIFEILRL